MHAKLSIGLLLIAVILLIAGTYVFYTGKDLEVDKKYDLDRKDLWTLGIFATAMASFVLQWKAYGGLKA